MKCKQCLAEKLEEDFYSSKKYKDSTCKECRKSNAKEYRRVHKNECQEYFKKYRENNKDKKSKQDKKYYENNCDKIKNRASEYRELHKNECREYNKKYIHTDDGRYSKAKSYAKFKNKTFTLTKKEYINEINKPCYYCNNILSDKSKFSIGLDRMNNNKGYEIDNVVSCCKICNTLKNKYLTANETLAAVKLITLIRSNQQRAELDSNLQQILILLDLDVSEIV